MKTITSIVRLTLIALLFSAATFADTDREELIERGENAYLIYCSNCHGQDATGNGPIAHLLTPPPPDLTLLKREGMKEFPFEEVYLYSIDRRNTPQLHGYKSMPVWGDIFGENRAIIINELIHYLETLQKNR
ncbi:MAG: c-type cytochrome [Candidatus Sedimenticola sp. (ex Thyasira tokunagai)]